MQQLKFVAVRDTYFEEICHRIERRYGPLPAYQQLECALAPVRFADRKAAHPRQALRIIKGERGTLHLDFLKPWTVDDAQTWLKKLPGILMDQHIPDHWTPDDVDDHHSLMKRHGQLFCHAINPLCGNCPLRDLCPTGRSGQPAADRYAYPDEAYGGDERVVKGA